MEDFTIRPMTPADYPAAIALWRAIPGMGLHSLDDSEAGIAKLLARNPGLSFLAEQGGGLTGCVMAAHDGRRGAIYHACVLPGLQNQGLATRLMEHTLAALKAEGITKVALNCYRDNPSGNQFWNARGWILRQDLNHYEYILVPQ